MHETKCDMKGYLSLLILWLLSKKRMTGAELAAEIGKRRGSKPSPGTIYPALKELKKKSLISSDSSKKYYLTKKGSEELHHGLHIFCAIFSDLPEMRSCCKVRQSMYLR